MLLPADRRELSPIMAISGLFTFGWTTSVMFNIVGDHRHLLEGLRRSVTKRGYSHMKLAIDSGMAFGTV